MNKRPLSVTIVGWFFIAAGAIGFVYHLRELTLRTSLANDAVWILVVRLLAVLGGVLTLKGKNTGRWLLIAWLAYHVVLSYFHDRAQLITHAVLLVIVAAALFYGNAGKFFQKRGK